MTGKPTARIIGVAARAFDAASGPLTFLQHNGDDDAYLRSSPAGNVLIVIPGLWTSMPPTLLAALRARRAANVTGRCPACDGVANIGRGGIEHENHCAATDDHIRPALETWGRRVGRYARGQRIVEDPA